MMQKQCEECEMEAMHKGYPVLPCGRYLKSPYIATPNGVIKALETWQMIVPLQDNEGEPFPEKLVEVVRADVLKVFGGDTETNVTGSWKQGQRIYVDENVKIEIDVFAKDHDQAEVYMAECKRQLSKHLKQEKIYVTYLYHRFELLLVDEFFKELNLEVPEKPKTLSQTQIELYRTLASASLKDTKK
jgi:hypothetical protein